MKLQKNPATRIRRNIRLVMLESAITDSIISMSIMSLFFEQLGMTKEQVALTQSLFTVISILLNFPLGWVADRFSRKWANVIGDFGAAIGFLAYSQARGFYSVLASECWLGICLAFSQGVDQSLLQAFTNRLDPSGELFHKKSADLASFRYVFTILMVLLGGPLGAISYRLAIAASGVSFLIGGIVGLFVYDDSVKLQATYQNPLQDIGRIGLETWQNRPLLLRILAFMVSREMTHGIIWVFTPMMVYVGVPVSVVSLGWAFNSLTCLLGSRLAAKFVTKLNECQILAIPLALMSLSMGIMALRLNYLTIVFYLLMGVVQGWTGATMLVIVQDQAKESEQTSIISLARASSQLLYIPTVWLIGKAADINLQFAPLTVLVIFLPLGILVLRNMCQQNANPKHNHQP